MLGSLEEAVVVFFDGKEVVGSVVLEDLPEGGLVGVQGVEHDELAVAGTDLCQEFARGGDFVAFGFD